jgi:hypothetical protein
MRAHYKYVVSKYELEDISGTFFTQTISFYSKQANRLESYTASKKEYFIIKVLYITNEDCECCICKNEGYEIILPKIT